MKYSLIIPTLCVLLLGMAACTSEGQTPTAVSETTAALDVKTFAGNFGGDDIALVLNADGSYVLSGAAVSAPIDGSWGFEENGKRIRLNPNSKSEEDWLYGVTSNDELQALDSAGNPLSKDRKSVV